MKDTVSENSDRFFFSISLSVVPSEIYRKRPGIHWKYTDGNYILITYRTKYNI